jgi:CelD/BcsL family acetyltransferase involved in cellulose biosynthesis
MEVNITVFEVEIENGFEFLSADYADLFARSVATPFQHPIWLDRFYRRLAPALCVEPLIIVVRQRPGGRLVMLLPLIRRRRAGILKVVEFADLEVADYVSPVCDQRALDHVLANDAAIARIRRLLRPIDFLHITKLKQRAHNV